MSDQALIYGGILIAILMIASGFGWLRSGGDSPAQREEERTIASEVIARFLFRIALPVLLLLGVPIILLASAFEADWQLFQALVAGLVIALGWLTTSIFNELERKRARAERLRDYHKALYAEIQNSLDTLYQGGEAENYAADIVRSMEADPHFLPFVPQERHDTVFSALLDNIEVLPRQTIDAIISYYSVMESVSAQAADMRSPAYAELPQHRRVLIYKDYFDRRKWAFKLGQYTLGVIKAFSDGGAQAAEAYTARFNSPDADRDPHPSSGSE